MSAPLLVAAADSAPLAAKTDKARNPNEVVCETAEVIGSRLATKRVCATRAEWQESRLQERMQIDRGQMIGRPGGN